MTSEDGGTRLRSVSRLSRIENANLIIRKPAKLSQFNNLQAFRGRILTGGPGCLVVNLERYEGTKAIPQFLHDSSPHGQEHVITAIHCY